MSVLRIANRLLNGETIVYRELYSGDEMDFEDIPWECLTAEAKYENGFADESYYDTSDNKLSKQNMLLQQNELSDGFYLYSLYKDGKAVARQLVDDSSINNNNLSHLMGGKISDFLQEQGVQIDLLKWQGTTAISVEIAEYKEALLVLTTEIVYGNHQTGLACIAPKDKWAETILDHCLMKHRITPASSRRRSERFFAFKRESKRKSSEEYQNALISCLRLVSDGYTTGNFTPLYSALSESCVFNSFWVLDSLNGKEQIVNYLSGKGEAIKRARSFPQCILAEVVNMGTYGLYMHQGADTEGVLVLLELDECNLIRQIDLTSPAIYSLRRME